MKKYFIIILIIYFVFISCSAFCDYVMMCTFFSNPEAKVFKVSNDGDIVFDYTLKLTEVHEPVQLVFAPNGKWGMAGYDSGTTPETQLTTILKVDNNYKILVIDSINNEYYRLVAISPDSRYGVYGDNLQTLRFNSDNTYEVIPTENDYLVYHYADFSCLNGNIIGGNIAVTGEMCEFTLLPDGRTTSTGVVVDITPSTGFKGLKVSPDGKTCIVLSIAEYNITSLRINEEGGFSIAQQFQSESSGPQDVGYTPDSKYALVSFNDDEDGTIRSFLINEDSTLTTVDYVNLPDCQGEDMAVTPDGKFAITRKLMLSNGARSFFYVVRINADGTLDYLPEKDYNCLGFVSDIEFVPLQIHGVSWILY